MLQVKNNLMEGSNELCFSLGQIIKFQVRMLQHEAMSPSGKWAFLRLKKEKSIFFGQPENQVTTHVNKVIFWNWKTNYIEN